ncbi:MAG: hypothetical protein NWE89_08730 [Candidatus Bathyarchaeota archaeon]|nr:hypothetical protein [Candidatus Bathyarchaeota archaeon]
MDRVKLKTEDEQHLVDIAEDLYSTLDLMAKEHGVTVDSIVNVVLQMAFESASIEMMVELAKDG